MDSQPGDGLVVGVDTGGTFTDVFVSDGRVLKVPSTPHNPVDAIISGLDDVGLRAGDAVAHGTTVATNAVLERKGARTSLLTTAGFEDVLEIRRQNRPSLYDLLARWPDPLVPREWRHGVAERLDYEGRPLLALTPEAVSSAVDEALADQPEAIAVCLLYGYANPAHERSLGAALARTLTETDHGNVATISLSHQIAPQYGEFERTSTTVLNAYLTPAMRRYLETLRQELAGRGVQRLHVMHSNGGLISAASAAERPVLTVLSGPAGGVVGARAVASRAGFEDIITFDMGGTSTDVAVVPGQPLERGEGEIASFPLLIPMLTIETVGAGGGSIARVDAGGGLHVGPESAGADPGPAAYGRGSEPTVTDANLVLGRLSPLGLLGGDLPLNLDRARSAVAEIGARLGLNIEEAAWAIVRLANSNMERAVRSVSLQRGYDPRRFTLVAFGGAGPLHAAELAEGLGVDAVLVPPHPGVMAALGLTVPDLRRDFFRTVLTPLTEGAPRRLDDVFDALEAAVAAELAGENAEGFGEPERQRFVDMRYVGQSYDLRVPYEPSMAALSKAFEHAYTARYGATAPGTGIEVVNIRLAVTFPRLRQPLLLPPWPEPPRPSGERDVLFGAAAGVFGLRSLPTPVLWRPSLSPGSEVRGPAVLDQYDSTTLLPPGWAGTVDRAFNLILRRDEA